MGKSVGHGGRREGSGRKRIADESRLVTFRLSADDFEKIPEPRSVWMRKAVKSYLTTEKNIIESGKSWQL